MPCDIALYIHFPFCRRKCSYCSFVSYQGREADIPVYLDTLKGEMAWRAAEERISSIYLGGGTPSLLSVGQLADILSAVHCLFTVDKTAEITIEVNPGTVSSQYLAGISDLGINRLSVGVQSFNDNELSLLGRIHSGKEAREAVQFARNSGFENLNIDLIYGLPGQTLSDWRNTLEEIIEVEPEHISLYALTLEADTYIARAIENRNLPTVDSDISAAQYELAEDLLAEHGYQHYEISNWAKPGRECCHNMVYWQNLPYLGVGVAAHSYLNSHRLANTKSIVDYIDAFTNNQGPVWELDEEIGIRLQLAEAVILGLRMCRGVCLWDIQSRFGIKLIDYYHSHIEDLVSSGLLEYNTRYIWLTRRGRLLSNEVFWRFLPD